MELRRRYLSMLACGGLSIIAGCATFGSAGVAVSIDNKDSEAHTVAMEVQRQTGETLFERKVDLTAGESLTFEDVLPNPSEETTLVAHVALDESATSHEFQVGVGTGTSELVVNIKQGGGFTIFVSQP